MAARRINRRHVSLRKGCGSSRAQSCTGSRTSSRYGHPVVTTSPESALKILRNAHLKVTSKQPIHVPSDLDIFENHQDGTILWQPTGEETWTRLGA